jgi:hypothetical protein
MYVLRESDLIPGALYRDVDGTIVHLLSVRHGLCTWATLSGRIVPVQVTHAENFRARFRRWRDPEPVCPEAREAA